MIDRPRQRDLKLELTWVGKDHRPRLEPRILLEDPECNYHAAARVTDEDQFENMLIFGDNLLALQSLATDPKIKGKVKCIFIDPPYNTGSTFEHYDDGMEHSLWLSMIRERLELLRQLLSDDGSIWITIDDNEMPYLRIICDEIFGRRNFTASVIWQKVYSERMDAKGFSTSHDYIVVYQSSQNFKVNPISKDQDAAQFSFYDKEKKLHYRRRSLRKEGSESLRKDRPTMWYAIESPEPEKTDIWPLKPDGTEGRWRWKRENVEKERNNLDFVKRGDSWEIYVKQYLESNPTRPPATLWPNDEVGHNHEAKSEVKIFNPDDVFDTPKPERLLQRIIHLATNPGDLVLDSFAGSGTTGAVAHKMGRRWIMVELGEHAHTHIIPRMRKVIDGTDQGGISQALDWKGGGGFRYFKLASSLIKRDKRGNEIINPEYNPEMLAEACCKLKGFAFAPSTSRELWWQHGRSNERDFLLVTTRYMDYASLQDLSEEVGPERTLLVLVKAYDRNGEIFDNLTIDKIPDSVLHLAEWDHDDYSLNVENLPKAAPETERVTAASSAGRRSRRMQDVPDLFAGTGEDS
jgi:adenine-specific DNA-methyltransferase